MKVQNKEFWEIDNVIDVQDKIKKATDFELFMFEKAKERYASSGGIKNIKIFGCGTGREIESIAEFFNPNHIVASDIAENMIVKCDENLKEWKLDGITQTLVIDAKEYTTVENEFDLVTILNSMLTYVVEKATGWRYSETRLRLRNPMEF